MCAGAEEKGDAWAVCLLKWLQGQPGPALLSLFPQQNQFKSTPIGSSHSSDRSITPGQLNTSQPSTPPPADAVNPAGSAVTTQASSEAFALDLVCYCLQSGTSSWPGQLPSVRQLCKLALQASHNLEAHGHHVMALESHQVVQICLQCLERADNTSALGSASNGSSQGSSDDSNQQQQHMMGEWHDRLITASLLRCLVDTTHPSNSNPLLDPLTLHSVTTQDPQHFLSQRWTLHRDKGLSAAAPDRDRWRKLAQQQVKSLQEAGYKVDTPAALAKLQAVYDSLAPAAVVGVPQEECAESVATGGLFRSISGMSAASTPRRNSTFSRYSQCCCQHMLILSMSDFGDAS